MKIVSLEVESFKRLKAVQIRPDKSVVEITGQNAQGKSSVLDAIWVALAGKGAAPGEPINKNADKARIRVDLGELIVTRTFSRKEGGYTTAIRVETPAGAPKAEPQKILDSLVGSISFDPGEFGRMKPADQFDVVRGFVPGIDFKGIEELNAADYARRTELNRMAKEAQAAADQILIPDGLPQEPPDLKAMTDELANAATVNGDIAKRRAKRVEVAKQVDKLREEGNALLEQSQALLAQANQMEAQGRDLLAQSQAQLARLQNAPALPDEVDTKALAAKIEAARGIAKALDRVPEKARLQANAKKLKTDADNLTAIMKAREDGKQRAIAAAKMPIEGLGFGDGFVTLDGVPFEQASDAHKLRASVAIAMGLNPELRVIRVRDGSLLDKASLKLLSELVEANDFQCWIETVADSPTSGFVISDGAVIAHDGAAVAPPQETKEEPQEAPKGTAKANSARAPRAALAAVKSAPAPIPDDMEDL